MKKYFSIAIDGPSAAGKSTLAKGIAKELGFTYIDTGAMYRSVAFYARLSGVKLEDEEGVSKLLPSINIYLHKGKVFLNEQEVTDQIRSNDISMGASVVSKYHAVRLHLVELQRKMARRTNVVMDGRDIGTFVLPSADVKIFLVASVERRAHRRYLENINRGMASDKEQILKELKERDYQDTHRDFAPLKKADDAIEVDSSFLDVPDTFDRVLNIIKEKLGD